MALPANLTMLLIVRSGLHEGSTIRLVDESYTLGRNRDNDLILVDRWISRRHCMFSFDRGAWCVTDLGSTHGVRVNAQMIDDITRLQHGDVVELGEVRIDISMSPDAPPLEPLQVTMVQEHPAVLCVESGRQAGLEVRLENQIYTIGRTRNNDIILSDSTISRRHCLIGRARNDWYILDLNSRHGVVVNGELIDERQVLHGDESVQAGDVQLALRFVFDPLAAEGHAMRTTPVPMVLSILDGLHEGWEIPLLHPSYTLGRSRCNDLILADPSISRIHALFVYHRGRWSVEDLGSSLGIDVDGISIDSKVDIRDGQKLKLGDVNVMVRSTFSDATARVGSDSADAGERRQRARRKLRIIQTLPMQDMEQTIAFDSLPTVNRDSQERGISDDLLGRLEAASSRSQARDDSDMMDTMAIEGPPAYDEPLPLMSEEYIKTYSIPRSMLYGEEPPAEDQEYDYDDEYYEDLPPQQ